MDRNTKDSSKKNRKKRAVIIIAAVAIFLLLEWLFIGYRFNFGPFKRLSDIRLSKLPGNAERYSMKSLSRMESNPLEGQNVLFLGSSVTYGEASLREGIPEYFEVRLGATVTKEAVSGTTLTDDSNSSYVHRLQTNVDKNTSYSIAIIQLSTNDTSKKKPLGTIAESFDSESFDTHTVTGAMEYIIAYCKETWGCPVMFYTGSWYDNAEYAAMVQRLFELREKWGIGVIDLWTDDAFNTLSEEDRALYMNDNIHPTKAGYREWWCPEMEKQMLAYLKK